MLLAALASLRDALGAVMADAQRAERAVGAAVAAVLEPLARPLLDEAKRYRTEFKRRQFVWI